MNEFVPLKKAFEQNRYKDVVSGVVHAIKTEPLNASEIIQYITLALDSIERDSSIKNLEEFLLEKIAKAYLETQSHAKAKNIYYKLIKKKSSWENIQGLIITLANEGEIDELKKIVSKYTNEYIKTKNTVKLKSLSELLKDQKLYSNFEKSIEENLFLLEGNYKEISKYREAEISESFFRDASWQNDLECAKYIIDRLLIFAEIPRKNLIKKFFQIFINFGEDKIILTKMLQYFDKTGSSHVGFFFKENSGLRVELEEKEWIKEAFKKAILIDKPQEIDVELDLAEDLFSDDSGKEETIFSKIKTIENRIKFLLKNSKFDDAKRLYKSLKEIDPNNTSFTEEFESSAKYYEVNEQQHDWKSVLETLEEIEVYAKGGEQEKIENNLSWKLIEDKELIENFIEYTYALIVSQQEKDCIDMLNKVIRLSEKSFKEASYLKARCFYIIEQYKQARVIIESIVESCVLNEDELCEMLYVQAECYENEGINNKALKIYKDIFQKNRSYRLVRMKIDSLESL